MTKKKARPRLSSKALEYGVYGLCGDGEGLLSPSSVPCLSELQKHGLVLSAGIREGKLSGSKNTHLVIYGGTRWLKPLTC